MINKMKTILLPFSVLVLLLACSEVTSPTIADDSSALPSDFSSTEYAQINPDVKVMQISAYLNHWTLIRTAQVHDSIEMTMKHLLPEGVEPVEYEAMLDSTVKAYVDSSLKIASNDTATFLDFYAGVLEIDKDSLRSSFYLNTKEASRKPTLAQQIKKYFFALDANPLDVMNGGTLNGDQLVFGSPSVPLSLYADFQNGYELDSALAADQYLSWARFYGVPYKVCPSSIQIADLAIWNDESDSTRLICQDTLFVFGTPGTGDTITDTTMNTADISGSSFLKESVLEKFVLPE